MHKRSLALIRLITLLALLVTIPALIVFSGLAGAQGSPAAVQPSKPENVIEVRAIRMRPTVTLGGTVVPFKEVTLAAELPGRVKFLSGKEGDFFESGTLLVALNDQELQARRNAALAALRAADAELRSAGVVFHHEVWNPQGAPTTKAPGGMGLPSLFDQMFTTPMQNVMGYQYPGVERYANLYTHGTRIEQAHSAFLRAESEIQQLDAKIRDSKSIAPFGGMIITKLVEEGDTVQPGQPMLVFADTEVLQVEVDIPARLMYRGLREGDVVDARLDVGHRRVKARAAQIFPMADPQRHTIKVKFDLAPGSPAAPGMYAEIMVPDPSAPARDMVVIPRSAVIHRGSLPMVHVVTPSEERELRLVRLGESLDDNYVSVLSGLKPGERVRATPRGTRGGS
ncbi:MAG: efflux RND transporter periplasmic adaptor subunit [Gammaproteobacteria bacterium]